MIIANLRAVRGYLTALSVWALPGHPFHAYTCLHAHGKLKTLDHRIPYHA